ncbi:MAG: M48 family metalloprotease [Chitinophagaceae bacterium]
MKKLLLIIGFSTLILGFNNCATNPVTGKRQVVLMSEAQELAMGQEADPQIVAQFGLYEDAALQAFIQDKGKQMAAISHRPNITYHFKVIDSDVLNAFAVPGGYVYFTRGIMAHFNSEADFAGVLGHEIGHIAHRHTVEQQRNQMLGQLGLIAGMIISPTIAQFGEAASQGLGLMLLKFGRDAERESDQLGVEYSTKIGYDARQMANFFQTLQRSSEAAGSDPLPNFLSTHPDPGDRLTTVTKLAREWQQKLNLTNPKINREAYLKRIDGLIYGEDPKGGYRENNVFYHPVLKFQFPTPANWRYQNSPQQVALASPDGKAMMLLMLAQGTSLQQAAQGVLEKYKMTNRSYRELNVNGLNAAELYADQVPPQGQQGGVRTVSYLIQYGQLIYHMIGVAGPADFASYERTFLGTMQAFRELTDQAKINKKPDRVRIRTVNQARTLEQALRGYNTPQNKLQELAILNGMTLTERLSQGTLIKVIAQ